MLAGWTRTTTTVYINVISRIFVVFKLQPVLRNFDDRNPTFVPIRPDTIRINGTSYFRFTIGFFGSSKKQHTTIKFKFDEYNLNFCIIYFAFDCHGFKSSLSVNLTQMGKMSNKAPKDKYLIVL